MIHYSQASISDFARQLSEQYIKDQNQTLLFQDYASMSTKILCSEEGSHFNVNRYKDGEEIRVAPSMSEILDILHRHTREIEDINCDSTIENPVKAKFALLNKIVKPTNIIKVEPWTITLHTSWGDEPCRVWFNSSEKGLCLRSGFKNFDTGTPIDTCFNDQEVHGKIGGMTGSGKSVLINDIITFLMLEYAPWEVNIVSCDFKIVEAMRYTKPPAPHISMIAATGSSEYITSVFSYLTKDMKDRQEVFTILGVQNLKDFRTMSGLCVPRCIVLVDEFMQMYENIKMSASKGSTTSQEDKQTIDSAISELLRLGRNTAYHVILSSQDLSSAPDYISQIPVGITLRATPAISNNLIGNDAGARIRGRGKCIVNTRITEKNPKTNVNCYVPFLSTEGKLPDLTYLLNELNTLADKVGTRYQLTYFNESLPIPYAKYEKAKQLCKSYINKALSYDLSTIVGRRLTTEEIELISFKKSTSLYFPLGRPLTVEESPLCLALQHNITDGNVLVIFDDASDLYYATELLCKGVYFSQECFAVPIRQFYWIVDESEFYKTYFSSMDINSNKYVTGFLPDKLLSILINRDLIVNLSTEYSNKSNGIWDCNIACNFLINKFETWSRIFNTGEITPEDCDTYCRNYSTDIDSISFIFNLINSHFTEPKYINDTSHSLPEYWDILTEFLIKYLSLYQAYNNRPNNSIPVTGASLPPIVTWVFGNNFTEIKSYEIREKLLRFFKLSSSLNMFCFIIGEPTEAVGSIIGEQKYLIENTTGKVFAKLCCGKYHVNCNKNSLQLHNHTNNEVVASFYSRLSEC